MSVARRTLTIMGDVGTPWDVHREVWQAVVNERPIPARRAQVSAPTPIPVIARVVWERDGVEEIDTVAWGWTTRDVLVELVDPRRFILGIWLPSRDVRRCGLQTAWFL